MKALQGWHYGKAWITGGMCHTPHAITGEKQTWGTGHLDRALDLIIAHGFSRGKTQNNESWELNHWPKEVQVWRVERGQKVEKGQLRESLYLGIFQGWSEAEQRGGAGAYKWHSGHEEMWVFSFFFKELASLNIYIFSVSHENKASGGIWAICPHMLSTNIYWVPTVCC